MAKFKRGNLDLNTNQKIRLGDGLESQIYFDGSELKLTINDNEVLTASMGVELYHAGNKVLETDSTGVIVTGTLTTDNVEVTGSINLPPGTLAAEDVGYNKLSGATYHTVQDELNQLRSSGVISGGEITEDSTAQVTVTAGTGLIRTSDNVHAPLVFIDWAGTTLHFAEGENKYVIVDYNGGSPIVTKSDILTTNTNNMIVLGEVEAVDGALYYSSIVQRAGDFQARVLRRIADTDSVKRVDGMILGESGDGNRYVTMSSGTAWSILEKGDVSAIDTETGDEFIEYWEDGAGGWNTSANETQWPNLFYDDESGTLAAMNPNRYGNLWFYLIPSDNTLHMLYGKSNTGTYAEAESEPAPSDLPHILKEHSILLGRIIYIFDVDIAVEVQSSNDSVFNLSGTTDHGNLAGLGDDDHTHYSLVNGTRDFTGTVGGLDPVSDTDFSTKNYVDLRTPGFDGTSQLYLDFTTDQPAPSHKEGRLFWDSTCHTIAQYNDEADITQQLGQEFLVRYYNPTGETIPNGGVVANAGSNGYVPQVQPAKADSDTSMGVVAVATHEVEPGTIGYATFTGMVRGLDLSDYSEGSYLYVSDSTAGQFTDVRPKWPNIPHAIGIVLNNDSVNGSMYVDSRRVQENIHIMTYSLPLEGVTDSQVPLLGTYAEVGTGTTGDVATDWSVSNQHVYLTVNSLDGTGVVTITGASVDESTSVTTSGDTETILVDETGSYQTTKKWWEITNIDIPAGITTINYDYGALGYPDMGNKNFRLAGYRVDAMASGNNASFTLRLEKVQDDGDGKVSIVEIESIGVDSGSATDQIIDNLRTGADDRSYDPAVGEVWEDNRTFTFKQFDFNTYFTNGENTFLSASKDEGILAVIEGAPLATGIFNVDWLILHLTIEILPT